MSKTPLQRTRKSKKYLPTNIILFPLIRTSVRTLVDYWAEQGYSISNTRKGNLTLTKIVDVKPKRKKV